MATLETAPRRYAQAAFELAREGGNFDAWERALEQIAEFVTDPEVRHVLENTRVARDVKLRLIDAALGDLPPLPLNLAKLLVRKGRTGLARQIADLFKQMVESQEGVARARALTAVPLSDAERETLTRRLGEQTGHQIVLETGVDPALLGGVVIQIGDRLIDASTRARLEALRESLVGAV